MPKFSFSKSGSSSGGSSSGKSGSSSGGRTANVKTPRFSFDSSTKLNPISSSQAASMLNSPGAKLGLDLSGLGSGPKYKPSSIPAPASNNSGGDDDSNFFPEWKGGVPLGEAAQKAEEEARKQREFLKDLQQRKNRNEQLSLDKRINASQDSSFPKGRAVPLGSSTRPLDINTAIALKNEHERNVELLHAKQIGELADAEATKVAYAFNALGDMLS